MTALLKVECVYGQTKAGKTSRCGEFAEYWSQKSGGRPAHAVFSDGGGYGAIADLVDSGLIIPFTLSNQRGETLLEDMNKLSMGWWPSQPDNPNSKLEPPKQDVSCLIFDSGTSMCDLMGEFHGDAIKLVKNPAGGESMVATHVKVPEMPKDSYVKSGEFNYRFLGRSDYMGVQGMIARFVRQSAHLSIPSLWTFGETTGEDEYTKSTVGGPDFFGNKLTGKCGKWFGNLLHLDFITIKQKIKVPGTQVEVETERPLPFLFTTRHIKPNDPAKIPYQAGTRVDRRLWQKVPPVMEANMHEFYKLIDLLQLEAKGLGSVLTTKSQGE